jgi:hypothetical protein
LLRIDAHACRQGDGEKGKVQLHFDSLIKFEGRPGFTAWGAFSFAPT